MIFSWHITFILIIIRLITEKEKAMAEELQDELRKKLASAGVKFIDAETVYLSEDTEIAAGVVIEPFVIIGEKVKIGSGSVIKGFSHIEETVIGENSIIGPFARLRGGSVIGDNAGVGNFVEIARSTIGNKTAAWHLTYIADAEFGKNVEIGGGLVTCNFDGYHKHKTKVGDDSFVGSNVTLIAPVAVGKGAMVAAGTTASGDIDADELAVGRPKLVHKAGGAERYRRKKAGQ